MLSKTVPTNSTLKRIVLHPQAILGVNDFLLSAEHKWSYSLLYNILPSFVLQLNSVHVFFNL